LSSAETRVVAPANLSDEIVESQRISAGRGQVQQQRVLCFGEGNEGCSKRRARAKRLLMRALEQSFKLASLPLISKTRQIDLSNLRVRELIDYLKWHGQSGKYAKRSAKNLMSFDDFVDGFSQRVLIQRSLQTY